MEWSFISLNAGIFAKVSQEIKLEPIAIDPALENLDPGARGLFNGPKIETFFIGASYQSPRGLMGHGLIYPSDVYDYPAFAWDWGVFMSRGYIFTMVNLHPLRSSQSYRTRYIDPIIAVFNKYAYLHSYQKERKAEWSTPFHSGYDYVGRIPLEKVGDSINLILDYLDLWLQFWRDAQPQTDPTVKAQSIQQKQRMRETYKKHDHGWKPYITKYGEENARKLLDLLYGSA
jgi:hypothetical protein